MKFSKNNNSFISGFSISKLFSSKIFLLFKYILIFIFFFFLNLIKRQFVSSSNNFALKKLEVLIFKLLFISEKIDISLSLFFSINFSFNIPKLVISTKDFKYSDGITFIKSKIYNLSSKFNIFLFSLLLILFLITIDVSGSPLKKKKFP